jgi:hypothetical protein
MSLILDGTNGLSDVDGSAATPAIRGSDANTGVFFGTDIVGVSTGGTERVRVDASGNVGIGTSSPVGKVESKTATVAGGSAAYAQKAFVANIPYSTSNITSSLLAGFDGGTIHGVDVGYAYNGTGYNLMFATNSTTSGSPTERARIDSSGNLMVGQTSTGARFAITQPIADWCINMNTTSSGTQYFSVFRYDGSLIGQITGNNTNTSYTTSSDYRLKHDIQPMTGALAKVAALKPVTYKWNADDSQSQGFIAHELQEVVPECVTGEKDAVDADGNPQYQGIDTSFLVATLTAAIQEQQAIITALTARVEALEGAQA